MLLLVLVSARPAAWMRAIANARAKKSALRIVTFRPREKIISEIRIGARAFDDRPRRSHRVCRTIRHRSYAA